jgi:hypothetical protein
MESFNSLIPLATRFSSFGTRLCDFLTCLVLYARELRKSMHVEEHRGIQ